FLAGGFVAGVSLKHGASPTGMVINAALVGAGKESFDYWQKEEWDNFDWLATVLGGLCLAII
ncbi:MAG: hypothetical protein ABIE84_06985, partial [bacterium]